MVNTVPQVGRIAIVQLNSDHNGICARLQRQRKRQRHQRIRFGAFRYSKYRLACSICSWTKTRYNRHR